MPPEPKQPEPARSGRSASGAARKAPAKRKRSSPPPSRAAPAKESAAAPKTPPAPPETPPSGAPEDALPEALRARIGALGKRPRKQALRALILDIGRVREWTTAAELAAILGVGKRSLSTRHITPMADAGLLERRYPDHPTNPSQAYRTPAE